MNYRCMAFLLWANCNATKHFDNGFSLVERAVIKWVKSCLLQQDTDDEKVRTHTDKLGQSNRPRSDACDTLCP